MPLKLFCPGNSRNYLRPYGYGNLALPKAGVKPLTLTALRGSQLRSLGPLAATFPPQAGAIPQSQSRPTSSFTGAESNKLDVSFGLNFLGELIGALSGSTLGLKAAYKDAAKVEFEFAEVSESYVEISDIDSYLAANPPAASVGPFVRKALADDQVFLITATLEARQINVKASDEGGADVSLDVPVIQQVVGGNVGVSSSGSSSSTISYTSKTDALVFGAQYVLLRYNDQGTKYETLKLVKTPDILVSAAGEKNAEGVEMSPDFPDAELAV